MKNQTITLLRDYADRYETPSFIEDDPSWFMHQVKGDRNQEVMAFVASSLSYGSRQQFLPKIRQLMDAAGGETYTWVKDGEFKTLIPDDDQCFYRLYTHHTMYLFFQALQELLTRFGTLGTFASEAVKHGEPSHTETVRVLISFNSYFLNHGLKGIVPQPITSLCKRPCMFLRWMVRDNSPVDLGLWTDRIDKSSLLIPIDTHVIQTARRLGLLKNKTASWTTVTTLSRKMSQVFPGDPARGDFALYGADIFGT